MDFVTFEIAKKLKEKGFPQHWSDQHYILENEYEDDFFEAGAKYPVEVIYDYIPTIAAPTISQVLKWLREEKEVDLVIEPIFCYDKNIHREYGVRVFAPSLNKPVHCGYFNMWEQAAIAGIEYVLDNLI